VKRWVTTVAVPLALIAGSGVAEAQIRANPGFDSTVFPRNDDNSVLAALGFTVNFFGTNYSQIWVNNNGNATFDGPLGTFTPFNLITTNREILAPFFADVDTRNLGGNPVRYGTDVVNGNLAFGINWLGVGYYNQKVDKLNDFQLVIIDRSDISAGAFDFEFNYGCIEWETGDASGGSGGLGGNSARIGWSDGVTNAYERPGSGVPGSFIGCNLQRLAFEVRGGRPGDPPVVPEPITIVLLGTGLAAVGGLRRRRRRREASQD
jgi:hypothetical protein